MHAWVRARRLWFLIKLQCHAMGFHAVTLREQMDFLGVHRTWDTGLCDCFAESYSCLDVACCLPCQISRQCSSLDGAEDTMMDCCYCCCSTAALSQGVPGSVVAAIIRYRVIEKFGISNEGAIATFFLGTFCFPCSMCQTHRELSARGCLPANCLPSPNLRPSRCRRRARCSTTIALLADCCASFT
jgi:Cys-rich protein (TIGR01571 family)